MLTEELAILARRKGCTHVYNLKKYYNRVEGSTDDIRAFIERTTGNKIVYTINSSTKHYEFSYFNYRLEQFLLTECALDNFNEGYRNAIKSLLLKMPDVKKQVEILKKAHVIEN